MTEDLYFASDTISGIKIDVVISMTGVRKILINGKLGFEILAGMLQIPPDDPKVVNVFTQLKEYLNRQRKEFKLPLEILGTDFQKEVWKELIKIPYGETISYGELANRVGNKKLIRAAAAANGANPIPIIIPCHRVIGSDGNLTGYRDGLDIKRKLLELEGSWSLSIFEE